MSTARSNALVSHGARASPTVDENVPKALIPGGKNVPRLHESTSRALVLREAAWGKGELATTRKISGQDKLRLLAKEMMETAVRAPFRMEELLRMAESQFGVHLDEISSLKDPECFCDDVMNTINSRMESVPDKNGKRNPPLQDPAWVASAVGTRIHNVYTLAGSWRIVRNTLKELTSMGLRDTSVPEQLRNNPKIRAQYLMLYDIVTTLARLGQQRVANNAAATPHYAPYFTLKESTGSTDSEMGFDYRGNNPRKFREAHKSYIDAIILELVLPDSQYPPFVLMSCLHDAVDECRKEEKRFTQALWDSVGDLSVTIQVLDLLESPLPGPESETWIRDTVYFSKHFTQFLTVQSFSAQACTMVDNWKSFLRPLTDTKKPHVLAQLWNGINKTYRQVSGVDIDTLWSLHSDLDRAPQWSTYYLPMLPGNKDPHPDDRALTLHKDTQQHDDPHIGKGKKRIILGGESGSDDDDMPDLMSVSDSSADGDDDDGHDTNDEVSGADYESDFDPDEDEWLQDLLQDALNAVVDTDDFPVPVPPPVNAEDDNGTENPFKRMFSRLKDRVFSANPTLKANEQSRRPFKPRPGDFPPPTTRGTQSAVIDNPSPPLQPTARRERPSQFNETVPCKETEERVPVFAPSSGISQKGHHPAVEEVEDEDDQDQSKKKRKKKKKKPKKSQETAVSSSHPPQSQQSQMSLLPQSQLSQPPLLSQSQSFQPPPLSPQSKSRQPASSDPSKRKDNLETQSPRKASVQRSANETEVKEANFSRSSLPLPAETAAQSARSYLHSENLIIEKTKVKSRPAHASGFFKSDKEKRKPSGDEDEKGKGFFGRNIRHIRKGTVDLLSRLINPADGKTHAKKSMKWEEFVKVMCSMGFSYDPSTAGSSVRFDPPDPKDQSITFHKPHPDSTLQRSHLRDFGKRLKKAYGWSSEQFKAFLGED